VERQQQGWVSLQARWFRVWVVLLLVVLALASAGSGSVDTVAGDTTLGTGQRGIAFTACMTMTMAAVVTPKTWAVVVVVAPGAVAAALAAVCFLARVLVRTQCCCMGHHRGTAQVPLVLVLVLVPVPVGRMRRGASWVWRMTGTKTSRSFVLVM
jgi:hypothetical protein